MDVVICATCLCILRIVNFTIVTELLCVCKSKPIRPLELLNKLNKIVRWGVGGGVCGSMYGQSGDQMANSRLVPRLMYTF